MLNIPVLGTCGDRGSGVEFSRIEKRRLLLPRAYSLLNNIKSINTLPLGVDCTLHVEFVQV